jgi:hypothetical protein
MEQVDNILAIGRGAGQQTQVGVEAGKVG